MVFRARPLGERGSNQVQGTDSHGNTRAVFSIGRTCRKRIVGIFHQLIGNAKHIVGAGTLGQISPIRLRHHLSRDTARRIFITIFKDLLFFLGAVTRGASASLRVLPGDGIVARRTYFAGGTVFLAQVFGLLGNGRQTDRLAATFKRSVYCPAFFYVVPTVFKGSSRHAITAVTLVEL